MDRATRAAYGVNLLVAESRKYRDLARTTEFEMQDLREGSLNWKVARKVVKRANMRADRADHTLAKHGVTPNGDFISGSHEVDAHGSIRRVKP